ncbi:hypothetical protein OSB04_001081 [Centaurea solstitialis]|uniref:Uncharacterized protein n=1 Tax=Centaurea solstitialis TaxID=347529 RepID=A0AA38WSG8_9ASTR|nr:hypothetical protein OSB04_001081 [Centaurea solstitialis]
MRSGNAGHHRMVMRLAIVKQNQPPPPPGEAARQPADGLVVRGLGLLPGLLEIDPPVNDQTEFPLAGSNPGMLHEQTGNNQYRQGNNFQNQNSNFQNKQAYQNRQPQQAESSNSMENWVKGFMTQTQASIRNLETQISQLAANQANRPAGTLPSNTEVPRAPGKEHVKAMALRNGKELEGPVPKTFETTPRKEFEPTFKSKSSTPLPTIFEEPEGPSQPIRNTETHT